MQATNATPPDASDLEVSREKAAALIATLEVVRPRIGHEISGVFHQALQILEAANPGQEELLPLIYDVRLWFISPGEVWGAQYWNDKLPPLNERFGDLEQELEYLPAEAEAHFQKRYVETRNPFLQARYSDFLACRAARDKANQNESRDWVLRAIPSYLQSVPILADSPDFRYQLEAIDSLGSAAHLASLKAPDLLPDVARILLIHLKKTAQEVQIVEEEERSYGRWGMETGWIFLGVRQRQKTAVADADLQWWKETATKLAKRNGFKGEPFLEQGFWSQAAHAADLLGDKAASLQALHEVARARASEARARAQGQGASFLAAAGLMESAVDYLDGLISGSTNEQDRVALTKEQKNLKLEIRNFYREGEKELGVVTVPFDVSPQTIEEAVRPFIEPIEINECLKRLGASLLPDVVAAQMWAQSRQEDDSISTLFGTKLIADEINIASYDTPEEKFEFERNRALEFQLHLTSRVLLPVIWDALREQKGLSAETLLHHLDDWGLLSEENRPLIQIGIGHYFTGDFVSALHILVPQLEDVIRDFFESVGLPPAKRTKSRNGWEFETFGGLLHRVDKVLPGVLPEELRIYIERTLSDPTGWNLRNRIAHGLISLGECHRFAVETVLHIYLSFTLFEKSTSSGEINDNNSEVS